MWGVYIKLRVKLYTPLKIPSLRHPLQVLSNVVLQVIPAMHEPIEMLSGVGLRGRMR